MIDMHCHLLYGVDDGPDTIEESVAMLKEAKNQGIDGIILTPHYRHGMFAYPKERIESHFEALKPYANKLKLRLYLGTEYHVNSWMLEAFDRGRCHSLADSRHILTEYDYESEPSFLTSMTREAVAHGYVPVIAHVERYRCIREDADFVSQLQEMGALIQINADAVLGKDGFSAKRLCKRLLNNEWVDLIASDSHGIKQRACHMQQCYEYICKKYSKDYANELMSYSPSRILK